MCIRDRYCADMTRTFFFGEPTQKQREVYETVRRAKMCIRDSREGFVYLARSIKAFPDQQGLAAMMEKAGFCLLYTSRCV